MKLSLAAELALRGSLVLAERYGQGLVTLEAVCAERKLPRQYLTKIFAALARADLVTAIRGKRGGYRLNRPPGQVTVLEIVEAVEGPIVLNFCQHKPSLCEQTNCRIRPVWAQLQQVIRDKLGGLTLGDCLSGGEKAE
jgi:Rrf2 family protein